MQIKRDDFKVKQDNVDNKFYTYTGQEEFYDQDNYPRVKENSHKVFAKALQDRSPKNISSNNIYYSYYLLLTPDKELYNPQTLYSIETKKHSFVNRVCKSTHKFEPVPKSVFDKYLIFLQTGNSQWYNAAQRELR